MKKIILSIIPLMMSQTLWGQSPWWTSSDSVHVFSRNTGSVLIGSYEPLGKLTLGTDALNTSLALVGDYNNFAKNYLKIGVFGRSTDKIQGQAFFDLYHSNANPKNVGYNFRVNARSLFYINSEGNVGIGTDKPQAGLDISSAASWGSFKKGLRLAPDNALAIDAGTIKYGIVGNENNLHFFSTNSDEKLSPFGNAFTRLVTFQPKKVVIEGDLEVKGRLLTSKTTQADYQTLPLGFNVAPLDNVDDNTVDGKSGGGGGITMGIYDSTWVKNGTNIINANTGNVGIGTPSPAYKLDLQGTLRVSSTSTFSGAPTFSAGANFPGSGIWNSSGNLGIGTASPLNKFQINISRTTTSYATACTTDADISATFKNTSATSNNFNILNFAGSSSGVAQIGSIIKNHTTPLGQLFFATRNGSSFIQRMLIDENGNIGIGTTNPLARLAVDGNGSKVVIGGNGVGGTYQATETVLELRSTEGSIICASTDNSASINLISSDTYSYNGIVAWQYPLGVYTSGIERMTVTQNGNVGIGTSNPDHKLAVNGTIKAKELYLTVEAGQWSDHVFSKNYRLRSLDEVEKFVTANKHLPGIQSEPQLTESGLRVMSMQSKLLEKIEELTLYVIDLNRRLEKQEQELTQLRKLK